MSPEAKSEVLKATLGTIARQHRATINDILDLYAALGQPDGAGPCMQCFFKILGKVPPASREIGALRQALEEHVEVIASDDENRVVRRFDVQIEEPDLESFCRKMMTRSAESITHTRERLVLTFRYRRQPAA
ncbi:MAG: hypothetical protein ACFB20_09295 [Opitutales bacterium]